MTDKREPSLEPNKPRPAAPEGAPRAAAPASPPNRAKGPPVEPEAFQRWLGIERLKVDMRRLEIEGRRAEAAPARASHPALALLYGIVLVAVLGIAGFLAAQMLSLREEIGALRGAQSEIAEKLASIEAARAAAPVAVAPAPAPAQVPPAADSALIPPAPGQTALAAPGGATEAPAEAPPALPGAGYTVRIFAPVNSVSQAKLDSFTAPLKAAGFDVVTSDTGVVQTTSNTMSYFGTTEEMANKVAGIIQKKHPAIAIEMRASPSIPASARQIIILNLTEDTFN